MNKHLTSNNALLRTSHKVRRPENADVRISKMKHCPAFYIISVTLLLLQAGCAVPAIMTPRITVSGVVLDQHDQPVPNATVEASWIPVTVFPAMPMGDGKQFRTDEAGRWSYSMRGVHSLSICPVSSNGYYMKEWTNYSVKIVDSGQQLLTNCILRIEKIK